MVGMSFVGLFVTCVNFLQRPCSLRYFHGTERDDVSIAHITISQAGALFSIENVFFCLFWLFCREFIHFLVPLLGPGGPLIEPVEEQSGSLIYTIQAYMPHESSEVSSNQPDGPMGSHRCPLDPLGPCRPTS